jgi:hypothetical protein
MNTVSGRVLDTLHSRTPGTPVDVMANIGGEYDLERDLAAGLALKSEMGTNERLSREDTNALKDFMLNGGYDADLKKHKLTERDLEIGVVIGVTTTTDWVVTAHKTDERTRNANASVEVGRLFNAHGQRNSEYKHTVKDYHNFGHRLHGHEPANAVDRTSAHSFPSFPGCGKQNCDRSAAQNQFIFIDLMKISFVEEIKHAMDGIVSVVLKWMGRLIRFKKSRSPGTETSEGDTSSALGGVFPAGSFLIVSKDRLIFG